MKFSKEEQLEILEMLIDKYKKHKELLNNSSAMFTEEINNLNIAIDNYTKAKEDFNIENYQEATIHLDKANKAISEYVESVGFLLSVNNNKNTFIN